MIAGVVLAAGASTRMGRDKALVRIGGASFLLRSLERLWRVCEPVVVVLGANAETIRDGVEPELAEWAAGQRGRAAGRGRAPRQLQFVHNAKWKSGMLSSARIGLDAALETAPEAVLLLPVDHPRVTEATVEAVAARLAVAQAAFTPRDRDRFACAVIPRYRHRRGHPVALTPALSRDIVRDRSATDLSDAIRRHASVIGYLDVNDAGVVRNLNTPERAPRATAGRSRRT